MKSRLTLSQVKQRCNKYGYGLTQEGESVIINIGEIRYSFSTAHQAGNWFYYHIVLDRNEKV